MPGRRKPAYFNSDIERLETKPPLPPVKTPPTAATNVNLFFEHFFELYVFFNQNTCIFSCIRYVIFGVSYNKKMALVRRGTGGGMFDRELEIAASRRCYGKTNFKAQIRLRNFNYYLRFSVFGEDEVPSKNSVN